MVTAIFGKIGSGKSTVAARLGEQYGIPVLESDELMLTLYDACLGAAHAEAERRCVACLCKTAARLDACGISSVLDTGLWTKRERDDVKAFFAERKIPLKMILVEAPDSERLRRVAKRNLAIAGSQTRVFTPCPETILRLDAKFEQPDPSEYDEIILNR